MFTPLIVVGMIGCFENALSFQPMPSMNKSSRLIHSRCTAVAHPRRPPDNQTTTALAMFVIMRNPLAGVRRRKRSPDTALSEWKRKYCSKSTFRKAHGRNKNGDCGEWSARKTRLFYNFEIERAKKALLALDLPDYMLGDLLSESRDKIKEYANERSLIAVRATVKFGEVFER